MVSPCLGTTQANCGSNLDLDIGPRFAECFSNFGQDSVQILQKNSMIKCIFSVLILLYVHVCIKLGFNF